MLQILCLAVYFEQSSFTFAYHNIEDIKEENLYYKFLKIYQVNVFYKQKKKQKHGEFVIRLRPMIPKPNQKNTHSSLHKQNKIK